MEEKKTLKIKKPYVVIITLAIVFAILGFMDMNVWAMESLTQGPAIEEQYFNADFYEYDYGLKEYVRSQYSYLNSSVRMAWYYSDFEGLVCDEKNFSNVITVNTKGYVLVGYSADGQAVNWYGSYNDIRYDLQEKEKSRRELAAVNYYSVCDILGYRGSTEKPTNDNYMSLAEAENYCNSQRRSVSLELDTNIPIFTDWECLGEYLETGLYDVSGTLIDYSNLFVDENMKYIEDIKGNRICFETLPEYTYFDYLTWKNDTTYEIQVERTPIVYFYKGYLNRELLHSEYMGFKPYDILPTGSSKLNCASDVANFHRLYPNDYEWYRNVIDNSNYNHDYVKLGFGYRLRYVDILNKKASIWIYIIPTYDVGEKGQGYLKFIQYSDGSFSHYIDVTGVQKSWNYFNDNKIETMEDVENIIDNALQYMDNRNEFKEDYGINDNLTFVPPFSDGGGSSSGNIVTDIDVNGATNWLQSVATFIKGTPAFVGSVLSFLPQPILYGIYVCIFLSVIAGGYAIIKALI